MMSVFICEDDSRQLSVIEKCVKDYIMMENLDMEVALSTTNPQLILDYLSNNTGIVGLYFFDIDLNNKINGLTLSTKIRKIDDLGKIVFVTTHSEMLYLTFTYKVEAMDYIIKDNEDEMLQRIRDCITTAYERYLQDKFGEKKMFKVELGDSIRTFNISDILFFESSLSPHKVILHHVNGEVEFYESIKNLGEVDDTFFRCHKSFVVNIKHVKLIDKKNRTVEMSNGETCLVSSSLLSKLTDLV